MKDQNNEPTKRIWLKCKECKNAWYDDGENIFEGCPECGGDFCILDEEELNFTPKNLDEKN